MAEESITTAIGTYAVNYLESAFPMLSYIDPWVFFGIMLVAAFALSQLVAWLLKVVAKMLTSRTKTKADDIFIESVQQPMAWLVFTVLLYIAVAPLELSAAVATAAEGTMLTLNIIVAAWLVQRISTAFFRVWDEIIAKKTHSKLDDTMLPILSKMIGAAIWIIAFLTVLAAWGFAIGPFLAGLGIAGLAIGFAVKDSLANIFGGIALAFDHAYRIGDKIRLADGTTGTVQDITLRSTRVRTFSGDLVMVPNGNMAVEPIYTWAQPAKDSRVSVDFGVEYGADPDKVCALVVKALKKMDGIEEDPEPVCEFIRMGDFALEMSAKIWVADYGDAWGKEREATTVIYKALNKSKVGIPYPTYDVHVKK